MYPYMSLSNMLGGRTSSGIYNLTEIILIGGTDSALIHNVVLKSGQLSGFDYLLGVTSLATGKVDIDLMLRVFDIGIKTNGTPDYKNWNELSLQDQKDFYNAGYKFVDKYKYIMLSKTLYPEFKSIEIPFESSPSLLLEKPVNNYQPENPLVPSKPPINPTPPSGGYETQIGSCYIKRMETIFPGDWFNVIAPDGKEILYSGNTFEKAIYKAGQNIRCTLIPIIPTSTNPNLIALIVMGLLALLLSG